MSESNAKTSFDSILDDNFRWPRREDRLLRAASWEDGARFADHPLARETHIWSGYMRAGAVLVAECERDDTQKFELIYPILFCYRHGLETAMKWIVNRYGDYAGISDYKKSHDLEQLWQLCKLTFEALGGDGDVEALHAVEQIVVDYSALDRESFAFRYTKKQSGATIELPEGSIDLQNIREVMEGVDAFFTGADGYLDAQSWALSDSYQYS